MRWLAVACILLLVMPTCAANAMNPGQISHFAVTYYNEPEHNTDNANFLDALERAYDHVNRSFGTCPRHVDVIIVDNKAMDSVGEQVDSFSAWNKLYSAIVLKQGTLKDNGSLRVLAEHEMTHLAINEILCKKDPGEFRWMEEGICMVVSKEPLQDADVSKYIVSHGFLNISEIFSAVKDENCNISKNGYMQSYSLVRYIVKRHGIGAVIHMLESPETSFDKAFRQCSGEDFRTFYKEWENYVKSTASR